MQHGAHGIKHLTPLDKCLKVLVLCRQERVPSKAPTLPEPSRAYVYGSIEGYQPRARSDEQAAEAAMPLDGNVMDELDALF